MLDFLRIQRESVDVAPHVFEQIGGIPITNTLLAAVLVTVLIFLFGVYAKNRFQLVPGPIQNAFGALYEAMLTLIQQITTERSLAREIFPLVGALFVYIGLANIVPLIPGVKSITATGESLFRTPTSDINLPLGLAAAMLILVQVRATAEVGVLSYLGRFFKFKELVAGFRSGLKDGFLALVEFFVGLLDIIAEFAKVISLSFRLFGNMFAGELLAVLILGAIAYGLPAIWLSLNLLFAVVHALVFGALVAGYYTLAVRAEGDPTEPEEGIEG